MCTVCIANNTRARPGCARPPAHTHTHRHTYRHTHRSGWGERQRETARASEKARDTLARAAPRRPLRPGSSPAPPAARPRAPVPVIYAAAASAGCGFLRPHPPPQGAPPTRGSSCRDSLVGVLFGGFCLGAAGATSRDIAQASQVAVSFFVLTLARCTSAPHPVPATSTPGGAATLLCCALLPRRRRQSFAPAAALGAAGRV